MIIIRLWLAQGKFQNFFKKREDACKRLNFLRDFEFKLHEGAGQAAATVMPGYVDRMHAAAAFEDLGELACAGTATAEEYSEDLGMHNLNYLHDVPNSHGLEADAATDLHENLLNGVFSVRALGGLGVTASVLGDALTR